MRVSASGGTAWKLLCAATTKATAAASRSSRKKQHGNSSWRRHGTRQASFEWPSAETGGSSMKGGSDRNSLLAARSSVRHLPLGMLHGIARQRKMWLVPSRKDEHQAKPLRPQSFLVSPTMAQTRMATCTSCDGHCGHVPAPLRKMTDSSGLGTS